MNWALSCTKEMASLADELIKAGIFKNAEKVEEGFWTGYVEVCMFFMT